MGAIALAAMAIGIVVGGGDPASSQGAGTPAASGSGTTAVQRRDLVATDTQAGTLGYADPRTVFNRLTGTITALPKVGAQIKPGGTLYQVDGAPVVLFDGPIPAYRTLGSSVTAGPDVAELKRNLIALGFDPAHAITVNDTFDAATTAAIDSWQTSLGETQTGQITLGQVVFLPGARRISAVTGVLGSTGAGGSSGGGSSSSSSSGSTTTGASAPASPAPSATLASVPAGRQPGAEFVSFTTSSAATAPAVSPSVASRTASLTACPPNRSTATTTPATTTTTTTPSATCPAPRRKTAPPSQRRAGGRSSPSAAQLLAQLVAAFRKLASASSRSASAATGTSARSGGASSAGGSSAGAAGASAAGSGASGAGSTSSSAGGSSTATPILQTTSAELVVTVQLDATKQSEAVVGSPVTVQLPDGSTDNGRITGVSSVAQSSSSSSTGTGGGAAAGTPTATVPVTVTLTGHKHVVGLDQAAVSVNFQQQVQRGVLSVPVTALLATPGGGYAVQTVQGSGRRLVAVTPGLFAGGYVEVSGAGLVEGMPVSDSQG